MKKIFTLFFLALAISAFGTSVTFKVSMKGSGVEYDSIFIVGSHTDWSFVQMADEGDSLFTVTLNLPAEDSVVYYYITIGWWASDYLDYRETVPVECDGSAELFGWDGDRAFVVPADPLTVAHIWGTCEEPAGPDAINDDNDPGFSYFPNPAEDRVSISLPGTGKYVAEIIDLSGKRLLSAESSASEVTFDVSRLETGTYFIRVTGNNSRSVRKLVVH